MDIYTYKITNKLNGKYYIGIHRGYINDSYMGSGKLIKNAIKKYGKENFTKEIIKIHASIEEAWKYEKFLVDEYEVQNDMSYNIMIGGRGGWEHVDLKGENNPMKRPEVAKKVASTLSKLRKNNKKYDEISKKNLLKAIESNTGKKKPKHSEFMALKLKELWKDKKFRKKFKESNSEKYTLISPTGNIFENVYLTDICKEYLLPFTTLWNSAKLNGKQITKGKAKGWICKKI